VRISPGGGTVKMSVLLENIRNKEFDLNALKKEAKMPHVEEKTAKKTEKTEKKTEKNATEMENESDLALFVQKNPYGRAAWLQHTEGKDDKYITKAGFTEAGRKLTADIFKKDKHTDVTDVVMNTKYKELKAEAKSFLEENSKITEENIAKFLEIKERNGILGNCLKTNQQNRMRQLENEYSEPGPSLPGYSGYEGPGAV
jgi:hypothetical protein